MVKIDTNGHTQWIETLKLSSPSTSEPHWFLILQSDRDLYQIEKLPFGQTKALKLLGFDEITVSLNDLTANCWSEDNSFIGMSPKAQLIDHSLRPTQDHGQTYRFTNQICANHKNLPYDIKLIEKFKHNFCQNCQHLLDYCDGDTSLYCEYVDYSKLCQCANNNWQAFCPICNNDRQHPYNLEKVGFGAYSHLSVLDLIHVQPNYVKWILRTQLTGSRATTIREYLQKLVTSKSEISISTKCKITCPMCRKSNATDRIVRIFSQTIDQCVICMDCPSDMCLTECGHICCCQSCFKELVK